MPSGVEVVAVLQERGDREALFASTAWEWEPYV